MLTINTSLSIDSVNMKVVIVLINSLLFLTTVYSYIVDPGPKVKATKGEVWPKSLEQFYSEKFMVFQGDIFEFKVLSNNECSTLRDAIVRYQNIITYQHTKILDYMKSIDLVLAKKNWHNDINFIGYLNALNITLGGVCDDMEYPSLDMKENYTLKIISGNASLSSESVWGILRGLETFSQLLYVADDRISLRLNETLIVDSPRFPHRGLLLDTSRHFIPLQKIHDTLDAMAYNKLNVFHWHIVDDQSFPYVSRKFPELSEKGAYLPNQMYSVTDVKDVIEYARQRGIRVLPEFDTPGHTRSWGVSHRELLTECYENRIKSGKLGPIDPSKGDTYIFLNAFFEEVGQVFPDQYIHLGGDEVGFECWISNPQIRTFMKNLQLKSYNHLENYYIQKLINIVNNQNSSSIVWEDVFDNGATLPRETIIQVWRYNWRDTIHSVVQNGQRALLSACWYLDDIEGGWDKFYKCEPYDFVAEEKLKSLILGGEACMWGELVNEYNVISRTWPRASAIAEKLWSSMNTTDLTDAARRLEEHTCRMNSRGIEAQPPNGPGYCP